ncbi:MAG: hypothetical protein JW922_09560 [Paludibacteraceae bacterium]|nr:hypothetical protein [Paludibacteraceae bacterium]
MRIYRGPKKKPIYDESYKYVSSVGATDLKKAVYKNDHITFNISKEGFEREAVCSAVFEDNDIYCIILGGAQKMKNYSDALKMIAHLVNTKDSNEIKLDKIKKVCEGVRKNGVMPDVGVSMFSLM